MHSWEAEYVAAKEVVWLRKFLIDLEVVKDGLGMRP